tara:strand:+ start:9 stop:356 length:348 start_codon:yes stop_codon:yes gene_type:complete
MVGRQLALEMEELKAGDANRRYWVKDACERSVGSAAEAMKMLHDAVKQRHVGTVKTAILARPRPAHRRLTRLRPKARGCSLDSGEATHRLRSHREAVAFQPEAAQVDVSAPALDP